jgi:membrane protease YdiL (CAAX protease family)
VENSSTSTPLAPSPTTWSRKSFPVVLSIIAALGAVFIVMVSTVAYFTYLMATDQITRHFNPAHLPIRYVLISQIVTYVPLIAYFLAVVPFLAQRSLAELGLRKPRWRDIGTAVAAAVLMCVVVEVTSAVLTALTRIHASESAAALLQEVHSTLQIIGFVAIAVVFAPLVEEFAFRVFLFNAIARYSTTTIGAAVSGLLFGFVHVIGLPVGSLITIALPLALGGYILAMVYARTGCYWANVITHGLFNAVSVVAVLIFHVSGS